jgi:hypothetical protein
VVWSGAVLLPVTYSFPVNSEGFVGVNGVLARTMSFLECLNYAPDSAS